MDFNSAALFGSETQSFAARVSRDLSSSNLKHVTAYIRRKHELLVACNAFARAAKLREFGNRHAFAERLDSDILTASLTAEKDLPKFAAPAWSIALAQARRKVLIVTKQLTALKTGLDHRTILQEDIKKNQYLFYVLPLFRMKTELDPHG